MNQAQINGVWWRCCFQIMTLGILFIVVREVTIGSIFYDVFRSFNWYEYWQYFTSQRLVTILLLICSIPPATAVIFGRTLKELKNLHWHEGLAPEKQEYYIKKLLRIRRWLVGYFFVAVLAGLVAYTVRGLLRVKLNSVYFFLELSPFGFSLMLLLFFSSLLFLLIDGNFRGLRQLLGSYLTGDHKTERQSRTVVVTMIFCFGFVSWLVIYYGITLFIVKTMILNEVRQVIEQVTGDGLSAVYRSLRFSLSEFGELLAYYRIFDAREMNLEDYVQPRNLRNFLFFVPVFATALLGFSLYLINYTRFYNASLATISLHVRALLRNEKSLSEQMTLSKFDDIGHLTGYLNLLFQLIYRSMKDIGTHTTELLKEMGGAEELLETQIHRLYLLNTVFARNGVRVDAQVLMVAGTKHGLQTLNRIIEQIKGEVANQGQQLDLTGTTVDEVAETVEAVSQHLKKVRSSVQQLGEVATMGQKKVYQSFEAVNRLAKISYRISDIVDTIGRISAQTGLLSMSAAVEAAHAGEHGEGFAVVSVSVRQLSDDADIQNKAIRVQIKEMINRVLAASLLSKNALSSLRGVQNGVVRCQHLIETISQAIDTQSQETHKLSTQIEGLRQTTAMILDDAETQIVSLGDLSEGAEQLQEIVNALLSQEGQQLSESSVVMTVLEDLRSSIDAGIDEGHSLSEALVGLRLD